MVDVSASHALLVAVPLLALQAVSVAIGRALRTYSRSRLEEVCEASGRADRADRIAHDDDQTERAAEGIAVVASLALASLIALASPLRHAWSSISIGVGLVVSVHLMASVVGRVWAETLLDLLWPISGAVRGVALPLTSVARLVETLGYRLAGPEDSPPRPASVEVEFEADADNPDEAEVDLPESTRTILEHVVALTRRDVSEIMTPRRSIVALSASISSRRAAMTFRESGLSRIPIFGENRDDILGILYAKDLFPTMTEAPDADAVIPAKLARPAYFVPESMNANDLLGELRARRSQIAIVLDEYGGVAGLITLEDLFEELVGPIDDEHDVPTPEDTVIPLGGSKYEVDAAVSLEDLNDRLGLHLPTDGDFLTVGGLAFKALGRLPMAGERFKVEGVDFTVVEVVDHSIRRVQLDLITVQP